MIGPNFGFSRLPKALEHYFPLVCVHTKKYCAIKMWRCEGKVAAEKVATET